MSAVMAIIRLDLRGITRDQVMLINVGLSAAVALVITVLGLYQDALPGWKAWFPFMVALSLITGPNGFAYLFGLLMVEEQDTGVRAAVAVAPLRPGLLMLTRTVSATVWMCVWPLLSIALMNSTWQAISLPWTQWLAVVVSLALLTPAFALAIPAFADDKVEALAVFKGLSFLVMAPLAVYFLDPNAWYRLLVLIAPTGWGLFTFNAFLDGRSAGYLWALGGAAYAGLLLVCAGAAYRRRLHHLS